MHSLADAVTAAGVLYEDRVNPQWVRLLNVLQMNVRYTRCIGAELYDSDGRRYLDFLSGYCVHNTGHNHPRIIAALQQELGQCGPAMLQSHVPELAGELAERLCELAGNRFKKVFYCSSGSEGVEAAIKFARARTRRDGLLYLDGAFHGLTTGALSMMGSSFWKDGFGTLLPSAEQVPFGDLSAVETKLATKKFAAFFVEPVQGEGGIRYIPEYLRQVQALCRRYGTLFVLDEVQTGMFRTGPFLAGQHWGLDPDLVVLAKALSGGLIPSGAVLMTDEVYESVFDSLKRAIVHTSTFSENGLAMRAGLATLDVLEQENLGERAGKMGEILRAGLQEKLSGFEMIKEVRGLGLLNGIEFRAPRELKLRIAFEAFMKIHPAMFGQMVVMRLFRDHGILTQMCGNNFSVLKAAPPLVVEEAQLNVFISAVSEVVEMIHTSPKFWMEALEMGKRAINI
jgi:ornithine--oxo-acid transaminase